MHFLHSTFALLLTLAGPTAFGQRPGTVYTQATGYRTITAVNHSADGESRLGFKGTPIAASTRGQAEVKTRRGVVELEAKLERLPAPSSYGQEFLTYVLWAVTPEGRGRNLGELVMRNGKAEIRTAVPFQSFGLIVTAEPYFSVTVPSYAVVAENVAVAGTYGRISTLDVKYELFERGQYAGMKAEAAGPKTPLDLLQARLAVAIARHAGAEKYSAESFKKATDSLRTAEQYASRKDNPVKSIVMVAREAVQAAEDSRVLAYKRILEERQAEERLAASNREAAARQKADEEARRAAQAAAGQQKAEAARTAAEQQRQLAQAETRAAEAERQAALAAKREAEAARREAEKQQQAALAAKKDAEQQAQAAEKARRDAEKQEQAALVARKQAEQQAQTALAAKKEAEQQAKVAMDEGARSRAAAEEARKMRDEADAARSKLALERNQAVADKQALRKRLLDQFNKVLDTRDTNRGLVLNMGDVLFDTGKFTLRPVARERLAKISGILAAYPGLKLDIEGHTDSTGGDQLNQKLSEQRAGEVGGYLNDQQVPRDRISTRGLGKTMPVADNDTAGGRQKNRRVEIIVSGEVIGTSLAEALKN